MRITINVNCENCYDEEHRLKQPMILKTNIESFEALYECSNCKYQVLVNFSIED